MKKHILLDKAFIYDNLPKKIEPKDCSYDRRCGLWRENNTGNIMMMGKHALKMQTKKCDVETGEDQKGE